MITIIVCNHSPRWYERPVVRGIIGALAAWLVIAVVILIVAICNMN